MHDIGKEDERSVVSMRTMEIVTAAILFAFGATFLYSSYKLGFRWSSDGPQSGFFPFYVSLFICVASAATLVQVAFSKDPKGQASFVERGQLKQHVPAGGLGEVERQRALVAVVGVEVRLRVPLLGLVGDRHQRALFPDVRGLVSGSAVQGHLESDRLDRLLRMLLRHLASGNTRDQ